MESSRFYIVTPKSGNKFQVFSTADVTCYMVYITNRFIRKSNSEKLTPVLYQMTLFYTLDYVGKHSVYVSVLPNRLILNFVTVLGEQKNRNVKKFFTPKT